MAADPVSLILPVSGAPALDSVSPLAGAYSADRGEFRAALSGALEHVDRLRVGADGLTRAFLAGEGGELHTVVLATQQAELAFEMAQQVRNKVVQAYQEIMRMQM